jgi:hypothetical protein
LNLSTEKRVSKFGLFKFIWYRYVAAARGEAAAAAADAKAARRDAAAAREMADLVKVRLYKFANPVDS